MIPRDHEWKDSWDKSRRLCLYAECPDHNDNYSKPKAAIERRTEGSLSERAEKILTIVRGDAKSRRSSGFTTERIECELQAVFEEGIESIPVEMKHQLDQWNEERMNFDKKLKAAVDEAVANEFAKGALDQQKRCKDHVNEALEKAAQVCLDYQHLVLAPGPAHCGEGYIAAEQLAAKIRALKENK